MAEKLTATDRENIQAYLSAMKALEAKEPEYNFADEASAEAWAAWNAECLATTNKYQDSIKRALLFSLGDMTGTAPQSVAAILHALVDSGQITTSTTARRAEIIEYPLDKINCVIWGLLERDTAGQIAIAAEKRGSKKRSVFYTRSTLTIWAMKSQYQSGYCRLISASILPFPLCSMRGTMLFP